MMQTTQSYIRTLRRWLTRFINRLTVSALSGVTAMIASALIVLPFLLLFKWQFGPVTRPNGTLPSLNDGWYVWLCSFASLVLFWRLSSRFDRWFYQRFGLSQRTDQNPGNNDEY